VHGTRIASASGVLRSSATGRITFVHGDTVLAYDDPGPVEVLFVVPPGEHLAALSADEVEWFTTSIGSPSGDLALRRHTSEGWTELSDNLVVVGRSVAVAPQGSLAAFSVQPDSLFLVERGTQPVFLGTGCSAGVDSFSPDESRILCRVHPWGLAIFSVNGGSPELVDLPELYHLQEGVIRWAPQGLQVVYGIYGIVGLYEQWSGMSQDFGTDVGVPFTFEPPSSVTMSSDGRKVAYWRYDCTEFTGFLGSCVTGQHLLHVVDVESGTTTRQAVHSGGRIGGAITFSPDGSMLAYLYDGLHLMEVD
jgi:hypothetical protein